jgi:hypothetical protein
MKDARPKQQIIADIAAHLEKHPPLSTLDQILRRFIAEIRKG